MKTRIETEVITKEKTIYIAEDGTEFSSEAFCKGYEKKLKIKELEKKTDNLVDLTYDGYNSIYERFQDADDCIWYKVNNKEDFEILKEYLSVAFKCNIDEPEEYPELYCVGYDDYDKRSVSSLSHERKNIADYFKDFGFKVSYTKIEQRFFRINVLDYFVPIKVFGDENEALKQAKLNSLYITNNHADEVINVVETSEYEYKKDKEIYDILIKENKLYV